MSRLDGLRLVQFPRNQREDGVLTVYENHTGVPFECVRTFAITGVPQGGERGRHAHKQCTQLLVALTGRVAVMVTDGGARREMVLDDPGQGLLVPPGLWVELTFQAEGGSLIVLCDRPYEAEDYLRDWDGFLAWGQDR